ncbi:MAG TPA: D-alanine--D-alanine ligase [Thermoanaerobaculia bacterium]|nr:D-alanine--D-alanine ligase [Thermoanaerobaculia bacterium]
MTNVTVLTGGSTFERNVALAGSGLVAAALRGRGHRVTVVDTVRGAIRLEDEERFLDPALGVEPPTAEDLAELRPRELGFDLLRLDEVRSADLLFLVLHGRQGEGGRLQSMLETAGLRYIGSDSVGSLLAMDKDVAKRLLIHAGVETPAWRMWPAERSEIEALGLPLVVKPSREGSTIGLTVLRDLVGLEAAVDLAQRSDDEVLLESFVDGRELTVGVLGEQALTVGEIVPRHEIFDYECKYTPGMSEEIFPAPIDAALTEELRALALRAHRALKLRDFSRVDFRVDRAGRPWCLEANTLPGMTATSLLPQSAAAAGIPFDELCDRMCRMALARTSGRAPAAKRMRA